MKETITIEKDEKIKEIKSKNISWVRLLFRTLTWEKIIIFWVLMIITYFVVFITINPPPPPDINYFSLIINVIDELIKWVVMPLVSGGVIGTAGNKLINNLKNKN